MKTTKVIINIIFILSVRFGIQHINKIEYPDDVKLGKKYRKHRLTDEGQRLHNWR